MVHRSEQPALPGLAHALLPPEKREEVGGGADWESESDEGAEDEGEG